LGDETPDVPGSWRLTLHQDPNGYRFALDAFLLADFVPSKTTGPMIDLGTGCGIVACLLARRFPATAIVGLELQAGLATMAKRNVTHNALTLQISIVQGDMRSAAACLAPASFAAVVCNPPYRAVGRGRLNPHSEKAIAHHEVAVTLCQVVQAARRLLIRRGRLLLVYHPSRLAELCSRLEAADLNPCRLRFVHPNRQRPATMVLVEALRGGRDALEVLPPLIVYQATNVYSAEMQAIFQGRALAEGR
jgi:tRNA1Val (adenine37-N6)-methyltransferase